MPHEQIYPEALNAGPWCRPMGADVPLAPGTVPRVPGRTLVVTVSPKVTSLWVFAPGEGYQEFPGLQLHRSFGSGAHASWEAEAVLKPLQIAARSDGGARAERFAVLHDLDRAVRERNPAGASAALDRLRELQPGILAILEINPPRADLAEYVATVFPY